MKGKRLLFFLGVFFLIQPAFAVQDYVSFTFSSTDIKDVVKAIAKSTGSNIITEKSVSGKITLALKDVYYERALELVAKTNGYVVRKIDNTYVIGPATKLAEGFDVGLNRTYKLNYAECESVAKVISGIFKKAEVPIEVSTDQRVNAVVVSGNQNALDKIDELIKSIDVPVHQVMIEAKIVEITTSGSHELGMKWAWGNGAAGKEANGKIFSLQEHGRKSTENQDFSNKLVSGEMDPFALGTFFRPATYFESSLAAAESTGNGKILSNPKIMAMNGKEAQVQIGDQVIYTGGPTQPPQEKDVGVILKITPRINDEGWITMDVEPQVSKAVWTTLPGQTESYPYPSINKRIAKTTVKVKDGEEILIGGLIQQIEDNSVAAIPILGDIPILKTFFSDTTKKKNSTELIFLITPHIVQQVEG
ncbi:MAG: secretin N-terminal domain-containing protein [Candidatus Wallbacteria bacterium]|nr:secretin N-terminal domain-containing protein [Candidatus Wallbacteria bacterium]